MYDPFSPGPFAVETSTIEANDDRRGRLFPIESWRPAAPGPLPLILYSHSSGGARRSATYLCTHLASHGYLVAALDHSELVAKDLARKEGETAEQKAARAEAWIASRVPDIRFLLDYVLNSRTDLDPARIGIVGHSFGGWTALAAVDVEPRIQSVVALAPGGASNPKPGILPLQLTFHWGRDVPTLYLVAENDNTLPLSGMYELFERTPASKQMVILRRADHLHFMDDVEKIHEVVRTMTFPPELSWLQPQMRPIAELCSGEPGPLVHARADPVPHGCNTEAAGRRAALPRW